MNILRSSFYLVMVSLLTFIMPLISVVLEVSLRQDLQPVFLLIPKWFIFWAVGVRLLSAGIKQSVNPRFTAEEIFKFHTKESYPVIRELGFANICFGLTAMLSLFLPDWRVVSAFASGIYFGIAGLQHLLRRSTGLNESFALFTDLFIFSVLLVYLITQLNFL